MNKLYFKYGAMGSSKTAQALMCKFNYEQKGFHVLLIKPSIDTRDYINNKSIVKSRIGLQSDCITFSNNENLSELYYNIKKKEIINVIIVDECQFCTTKQIDELKLVSNEIPVLCYGLMSDFKSHLFEGSKRLVEISESLQEIKSVCKCGKKAIMNARIINGKIVTEGESILIGGDESYEGMCYWCWKNGIDKSKQ